MRPQPEARGSGRFERAQAGHHPVGALAEGPQPLVLALTTVLLNRRLDAVRHDLDGEPAVLIGAVRGRLRLGAAIGRQRQRVQLAADRALGQVRRPARLLGRLEGGVADLQGGRFRRAGDGESDVDPLLQLLHRRRSRRGGQDPVLGAVALGGAHDT